MYPEEYSLTESDSHGSTRGEEVHEEELDNSNYEDECKWKLY